MSEWFEPFERWGSRSTMMDEILPSHTIQSIVDKKYFIVQPDETWRCKLKVSPCLIYGLFRSMQKILARETCFGWKVGDELHDVISGLFWMLAKNCDWQKIRLIRMCENLVYLVKRDPACLDFLIMMTWKKANLKSDESISCPIFRKNSNKISKNSKTHHHHNKNKTRRNSQHDT